MRLHAVILAAFLINLAAASTVQSEGFNVVPERPALGQPFFVTPSMGVAQAASDRFSWLAFRDGQPLRAGRDFETRGDWLRINEAMPGDYTFVMTNVNKSRQQMHRVNVTSAQVFTSSHAAVVATTAIGQTPPAGATTAPNVDGLSEAVWQILHDLDVHTVDVEFQETSQELAKAIDNQLKKDPVKSEPNGNEVLKLVYQNAAKPIIEKLGGRATRYWKDFFTDLGSELKQRKFDSTKGDQMRLAYKHIADGLKKANDERDKFVTEAVKALVAKGYKVSAGRAAAGRSGSSRRCLLFQKLHD